ncbi:MAG TPA: Rossmann-like and DUF2520 domain-containing protein [Chloroflexia bacterium]|nr:Rossmann-like and DUF2520 domain-containing protein [Chloroflexia bacterium]
MAVTLERKHRAASRPDRESAARVLPGPVAFVGAGKVGTALASLLHARGVDVAIAGRTTQASRRAARTAGLDPERAKDVAAAVEGARIVCLAVPDDAIEQVCREIADAGGWRPDHGVVHCSGALPSTVLASAKAAGAQIASFHPLQAFADVDAAIRQIPGSAFAIEGDPDLAADLDRLAALLGGTAIHLRANQKTLYHAAAAILSNYTVTLAATAADLLVREGLAPDSNTALGYLLPLLRGTVNNLEALGLPAALTGPIARGDAGTVARHLVALEKCAPEVLDLYRELAEQTIPLAREKTGLSDEAIARLRNALAGREHPDVDTSCD